jgi:hypothetical protein
VYAMRSIGCGYSESSTFSFIMDLPPPPNKNAFHQHEVVLSRIVCTLSDELMTSAALQVRRKINKKQCGVSVDRTWHRRGFASINGVVVAISIDTGKVLDTEVLTKNCERCQLQSNVDKKSDAYIKWKAEHDPLCMANYTGSLSNMETVGAVRMFLRSEQKRGLQYTEYYGDGDSKSYSAVVAAKPYTTVDV